MRVHQRQQGKQTGKHSLRAWNMENKDMLMALKIQICCRLHGEQLTKSRSKDTRGWERLEFWNETGSTWTDGCQSCTHMQTTFHFIALLEELKISTNPENKHIILKQNRPVRLFNTCSLIILMPEYIKEVQYKFDFNCFVHTPVKRNWLDTVHRQYVNTLFSYDDSFA